MADWAFRAYTLGGPPVATADLSMQTWQHEEWLNSSGKWSGEMSPPSSDASNVRVLIEAMLAATQRAYSTVIPWRNGVPLYEGVVWSTDVPILAGSGLLSYLDGRALASTRNFVALDQFLVFRHLLAYLELSGGVQPAFDRSLVGLSGSVGAGGSRDQSWFPWELKNIGEAVRQKAALDDGFDFDIRPEVSTASAGYTRRVRAWYPRRGNTIASGKTPVFTAGKGGNLLTVPRRSLESTDYATRAYVTGEEINSTTHELLMAEDTTYATHGDPMAPVVDAVFRHPDVKELPTLQAYADRYAREAGGAGADQMVLDVNPNDTTYPWGSWDLGDDCTVVIPAGTDIWYPTTFMENRRIIGHRWSHKAGQEHLQVVTGKLWEAS